MIGGRSIAAKENPDFICVNELGFPYSPRFKNFKDENSKLIKELQNIANEHDNIIISGSFHDESTLYNTSYVFFKDKEIKSPIEHRKKCSAVSSGELIRVPYIRSLKFYSFKNGYFSILICLDSYDSSIISQIIKKHKIANPNIDFIFVISYTDRSPQAIEVCKDISFASGSIVCYLNCYDFSPQYSIHMINKDLSHIKHEKLSDNTLLCYISYSDYIKERSSLYSQFHHNIYNRIVCSEGTICKL